MTEHEDTTEQRYSRPPQPQPRRFSRPRPSLRAYLGRVAAIAAVAALLLWGGLTAQLTSGGDPVLGEAAATGTSASATPSTAVVSEDDDGDDDAEESSDPEDGYGAVVIDSTPDVQAPTAVAPAPAPAPAPVQTATS